MAQGVRVFPDFGEKKACYRENGENSGRKQRVLSRMNRVSTLKLLFYRFGILLTVMRLFVCLAFPLLRTGGKDKTMKTPIEFDYEDRLPHFAGGQDMLPQSRQSLSYSEGSPFYLSVYRTAKGAIFLMLGLRKLTNIFAARSSNSNPVLV